MSRSNIQRSCLLSALEIIAVIISVIGVTEMDP